MTHEHEWDILDVDGKRVEFYCKFCVKRQVRDRQTWKVIK